MQRQLLITEQPIVVRYGEILKEMIRDVDFSNKQLIVIANQRYYDRFFEKINQTLGTNQTIDWFITTNQTFCNNTDEFEQLLDYLEKLATQKKFLFLAFGNEGVMQLVGFLQGVSIFEAEYWCLPISIRSLAKSLLAEQTIVNQQHQVRLKIKNSPQRILFDQTFYEETSEGRLMDLYVLLRCGLVANRALLLNVYQTFPNHQSVLAKSFGALIESLLQEYQLVGREIDAFGLLFEQAFYQTTNGHLLSSKTKRFLGCFFHLYWSLIRKPLKISLPHFLIWLKQLGFDFQWPEQLSFSEYCQNVLNLTEGQTLAVVAEIGELVFEDAPTEKELLEMMRSYQQLLTKI
ncbi:MAG: hypothetical protein ACK5MW_00050 [Enterococcus sp.]